MIKKVRKPILASLGRRKLLLLVLAGVTIGALVGRSNYKAGFVVILISLVLYLACDARRTAVHLINLKTVDNREKIRLLLWFIMLLTVISALISYSISYFLILILLALDYLLTEIQKLK